MDEQTLITLIETEESNALGQDGEALSNQRRLALQYYYGQPYGNEIEGRSAVVTTEVADAVEQMMPSLMAIFMGGQDIVRFEPTGPEDEALTQQETDGVHYAFNKSRNIYTTIYSAIKDVLLEKNCFLKVYWDKAQTKSRESYENLTDDEFTLLMNDEEMELVEHTAKEHTPEEHAVLGPAGAGEQSHDAVFIRTKKTGNVAVDALAPEEVLVSRETVDLENARFVEHRCKKSISKLREEGFDVSDDISDEDAGDFNMERVERLKYDDSEAGQTSGSLGEGATREVWVAEAYLRVDYDDDGIAELRKITKVGKTILLNEEIDSVAIITGTGIIVPHKLFGLSLADQTMDIQFQKSMTLRNQLDNFYFLNNGRYEILEGMVNMEDMMTSRPGGVVRSKVLGGVKRLDTPSLGAQAYQLLEYLDRIKEARIGKRTFAPGPDAELLRGTATGAEIFKTWDSERTLLIARTLAETLFKSMFAKIRELLRKHVKKTQLIRLRNQWIPSDPREWRENYDMTTVVGLGAGTDQQKLQGTMQIFNMQLMMMKSGLMDRTVTPGNLYNTARELAKITFPKQPDAFFTNPQSLPPPKPQVDPKLALGMQKLQVSDAQRRAKMAQDAQLDVMHMTHEERMQQMETMSDSQEHARDLASEQAMHKDDLMMRRMEKMIDTKLDLMEKRMREREMMMSRADRMMGGGPNG